MKRDAVIVLGLMKLLLKKLTSCMFFSFSLIQVMSFLSQKRYCNLRMQNKELGSGRRQLKGFKIGEMRGSFDRHFFWILR